MIKNGTTGVVLQLNHPSKFSILSAVEAKVFRESVMRDIFRPTGSTDCFLGYDVIESGVKKWKKCNKFYWILFLGNIFTKICWCCSTSGAFAELLLWHFECDASPHDSNLCYHFPGSGEISAESSRLCLFTEIYIHKDEIFYVRFCHCQIHVLVLIMLELQMLCYITGKGTS